MKPSPTTTSARSALEVDVAVVGGGLAGLAAATYAARSGARTTLFERSEAVGGRAVTHHESGFSFNVGPHALYRKGHAERVLAELGVTYSGHRPPTTGALGFRRGKLHTLPGGLISLLTTDMLSLSGKLELARHLSALPKLDPRALGDRTLAAWLRETFRDEVVGEFLAAFFRVTAYANDPERSSAAAAVAQLQHGLALGVLYLDGGWETLVKGLRQAAEAAGAACSAGARVERVRADAGGWIVERANAEPVSASAVVLATPPNVAAALAGDASPMLARAAGEAVPVKAACLDLGLERLPEPRRTFAVGIDRPYYFSVHSAVARLAPEGKVVVHVAKYLGPDAGDPKAVRSELESFCDVVQPGWRDVVAHERYLPAMMVTGALVAAGVERVQPRIPDCANLFVAGDWVGSEGMLADAALASAKRAGTLAAAATRALGRAA